MKDSDVVIYNNLKIIYTTIFLNSRYDFHSSIFFKTRHCNKPTLISKTEYKIVKTMTVKLIEIEVVFEINEA